MKNHLEDGENNSDSISVVNFYKSEISLLKDQNFFWKSELQQKQIIVEKLFDLQKDQSKINYSNKVHNKHDNSRSNSDNTYFDKNVTVKVALRIEKTEVLRKAWNFVKRTYFTSYLMRKHYFLLWTKERAFFPYFYHGIKHQRSNIWIKNQPLISGSAVQRGFGSKVQACNFTGALSFTSAFEDFEHIFPTCFLENFS